MTGYELKAAMGESVGFFFGSSYGSIYPSLHGLEKEGLVEVREVSQSGKPNRKVYSITGEGRERFRESLKDEPAPDSFRSEFLMHLFFGDHQDAGRLLELIEEQRKSLQQELASLRETEKSIEGLAEARYGLMCLRFGITRREATLAWLDEVEEEVRALAREKEVEGEAESDGVGGA